MQSGGSSTFTGSLPKLLSSRLSNAKLPKPASATCVPGITPTARFGQASVKHRSAHTPLRTCWLGSGITSWSLPCRLNHKHSEFSSLCAAFLPWKMLSQGFVGSRTATWLLQRSLEPAEEHPSHCWNAWQARNCSIQCVKLNVYVHL